MQRCFTLTLSKPVIAWLQSKQRRSKFMRDSLHAERNWLNSSRRGRFAVRGLCAQTRLLVDDEADRELYLCLCDLGERGARSSAAQGCFERLMRSEQCR